MKHNLFEQYGMGEPWAALHPNWPQPHNPGVYSEEDARDPCIGFCPTCGHPFWEDTGRSVGNTEECADCDKARASHPITTCFGMDIETQLAQVLRDYRQKFPNKWQDLLVDVAHEGHVKPVQANLDVYILGFHMGGISLSLSNPLLKELG